MGKGEELLEAVRQHDLSAVQKILNKGKGKILGSKKINVNYQVFACASCVFKYMPFLIAV